MGRNLIYLSVLDQQGTSLLQLQRSPKFNSTPVTHPS
jgi:hypothetical protein